jgi:hypothetical protein
MDPEGPPPSRHDLIKRLFETTQEDFDTQASDADYTRLASERPRFKGGSKIEGGSVRIHEGVLEQERARLQEENPDKHYYIDGNTVQQAESVNERIADTLDEIRDLLEELPEDIRAALVED